MKPKEKFPPLKKWVPVPLPALDDEPLKEAVDYREVLHPRDRYGKWRDVIGDLHRFTKADVIAGKVPGLKHDPRMSRGIAAHMYDREHITIGPGGYLESGKLDTLLMTHEVGHRVFQHILAPGGGVKPKGVNEIPEVMAFKSGGEGARTKFDNPFGINDKPEEMVADAYSALLHSDPPEHDPTEGQGTKDRRALLQRIARAARELGLPDRRIYRFKMEGSERLPDPEVPAAWPETYLDFERRWDALPDDAEVWLFHATDKQTAERMKVEGVAPDGKPMSLGRRRYEAGEYAEYQPGAGLSPGLAVGYEPWSISGYGRAMIAVKVRKGDVSVSVEQQALGATRVYQALRVNDAQVAVPIPQENIVLIERDGREPTEAVLDQLPP